MSRKDLFKDTGGGHHGEGNETTGSGGQTGGGDAHVTESTHEGENNSHRHEGNKPTERNDVMNSTTTQTLTRAALALVFFLAYGGYATTSGFTGGQSGQGTQIGFIQRGNGAGFYGGTGLQGSLAVGGQVLGGQALGGSASDGSFQGAGTGGACQGGIVTGDDGGNFKIGLRTGDSETGVIAGGETGVDDIDGGGF